MPSQTCSATTGVIGVAISVTRTRRSSEETPATAAPFHNAANVPRRTSPSTRLARGAAMVIIRIGPQVHHTRRRHGWTRHAGRMRFSEHELTAALTGAAKSVVAARKRFRRGGADIDSAWEAMDRHERFKLLDALGSQILPVLVALPDVEVAPGARPSYSDQQVGAVVAGLIDDDLG